MLGGLWDGSSYKLLNELAAAEQPQVDQAAHGIAHRTASSHNEE